MDRPGQLPMVGHYIPMVLQISGILAEVSICNNIEWMFNEKNKNPIAVLHRCEFYQLKIYRELQLRMMQFAEIAFALSDPHEDKLMAYFDFKEDKKCFYFQVEE
ncbi:hypothetical protein T4D_16148 [Trichinella pseudospiralis]|uniref:Uncharacterized protein n=1 Tax=Trichinella pseudospiralis TaxID=6337 RepID=A0A0V1G1L9_TRIPS|nr:hypothetical protein T4D_16148 [Trichinella pseudospiralis]